MLFELVNSKILIKKTIIVENDRLNMLNVKLIISTTSEITWELLANCLQVPLIAEVGVAIAMPIILRECLNWGGNIARSMLKSANSYQLSRSMVTDNC